MQILLVSSRSGSRDGGEPGLLSRAESLRTLGHEPGLRTPSGLMPGWAQDVLPYCAAAGFSLHAAASEGLPFARLDGMAAALPGVVTSNLYDDLEFLQCARVPRAGEAQRLAALTCAARRHALGERCRDPVARPDSVERVARDYIYHYELAIAGG